MASVQVGDYWLGPDGLRYWDGEQWQEPEVVWERCEGCGHEYRYPHLCRTHRLCGLCHPPIEPVRGKGRLLGCVACTTPERCKERDRCEAEVAR